MRGPTFALTCCLSLVALAGCGDTRASNYIAQLSDPSREVRLDAGYKLVEMGSSAVEPLIASATTGSDSLLYISAQLLGTIGDRRAVPFLRRLSQAANTFVRREAVASLGRMGDSGLVPLLSDLLETDPEGLVRAAAAEGLGNYRDTLAVPLLVDALQDTMSLVRQRALASLHYLWTVDAERAAIAALRDRDETVRYIAVQMLGTHRTTRAHSALCTSLLDSSMWVRVEAARALGTLGDTTSVKHLVRLLKVGDGPDHEAAREALRSLTGMDYVVQN